MLAVAVENHQQFIFADRRRPAQRAVRNGLVVNHFVAFVGNVAAQYVQRHPPDHEVGGGFAGGGHQEIFQLLVGLGDIGAYLAHDQKVTLLRKGHQHVFAAVVVVDERFAPFHGKLDPVGGHFHELRVVVVVPVGEINRVAGGAKGVLGAGRVQQAQPGEA